MVATHPGSRLDGAVPRRRHSELEALVRGGILTRAQADRAAAALAGGKRGTFEVLQELGFVDESSLLDHLARTTGLAIADLAERPPDPDAVAMLPEAFARRHRILPLRVENGRLVIATSEPSNVVAIDDVRIITGRDLRVVLAAPSDIDEMLKNASRFERGVQTLLGDDQQAAPAPAAVADEQVEDAPIVKAIQRIISHAVAQRASDIHIEPQEHDVRVRFRIDGVLHEVMRPRKGHQRGIVSRLKVMADLDIAERRKPQDGRMTVRIDGEPTDLRIATMPAAWGEEVVIRILDRRAHVLRLEDLGLSDFAMEAYAAAFRRPHGAVLVTGPTGSGKSTTLYATLNVLNDPGKKIVTVEDPIEARIPGVSQMQVNHKIGMSFATALRSILRADPDIVMVGEIRDRETATVAIEAPLTGHVMLSTLHTNDAPAAITRLIDMGVEPFLVASALECVVAQRLARRLCTRCRQPYTPTPAALRNMGVEPQAGTTPQLFRAVGCRQCGQTGYRGRVALVEVMTVTPEIEALTVARRSSAEIREVALADGMRSLRDDGLAKVVAGVTSAEEILRVVDGVVGATPPDGGAATVSSHDAAITQRPH